MQILTLAEKDVRLELRSKESIFSTFLFVILTLFIFNFSFGLDPIVVRKVAPGIIWVVIAFAGTIALSHLTARDHEDRASDGVLLCGLSGASLYLSKFITALLFMMAIEAITLPVFLIFFNFELGDWFVAFLTVLALGTIGYAALGTLFAAMLSRARFKDLLLPVVFYPFVIPLLIVAVRATASAMNGEPSIGISFMLGFDIIFITASILLFDFVVEEPK